MLYTPFVEWPFFRRSAQSVPVGIDVVVVVVVVVDVVVGVGVDVVVGVGVVFSCVFFNSCRTESKIWYRF